MWGNKMTDEEKAENYAKGLCKTCTFDTCRHNALQTCAIKESLKQTYLAGLKAGKPKWHKVADGDLPEYRYYVLVSRGTRTDKALYNKYEEKWYSYYDDDELDSVTAWCEVPKYTEE